MDLKKLLLPGLNLCPAGSYHSHRLELAFDHFALFFIRELVAAGNLPLTAVLVPRDDGLRDSVDRIIGCKRLLRMTTVGHCLSALHGKCTDHRYFGT